MKIRLDDPGMGKHDPEKGIENARIVPALGLIGLNDYVPNGSVIEVPDNVAGVGPHWREQKDGDDVSIGRVHQDLVRLNDDGSVKSIYDLGHGLLSQSDIWHKVEAPKSSKKED